MRPLFTFAAGLVHDRRGRGPGRRPPRFDVLYNPDLYKQDTPQGYRQLRS